MDRFSLSTMLRLALIFAGTAFASTATPANARPLGRETQALLDTLPRAGYQASAGIQGEDADPAALFLRPALYGPVSRDDSS